MLYVFMVLNSIINLLVFYFLFAMRRDIVNMISNYFPTTEYENEIINNMPDVGKIVMTYNDPSEWHKVELKDVDYGVEVITNEQERNTERKLRGY